LLMTFHWLDLLGYFMKPAEVFHGVRVASHT
jgi:hypothetical protein